MTGFYPKMVLRDQYPIYLLNNPVFLFFQDFIAPFYIFIKDHYTLEYDYIDDPMTSNLIRLKSKAEMKIGGKIRKGMNFELEYTKDSVSSLIVHDNERMIVAKCIE